MKNNEKIILHLCCDEEISSDSKSYYKEGYDVRLIGKNIGVENYNPPENVYGIIANPPCTQFSWAKTTGKPRNLEKGMKLVYECLRIIWESQYKLKKPYSKKTDLKFWMIENPYGLLQYFLGKPVLIYSPFEYGDNYKKKTCLWGNFNIPKKIYDYEVMSKEEIDLNKTNSRKLPKFDRLKTKEIHTDYYGKYNRQRRRSICSPFFAKAFYEANK